MPFSQSLVDELNLLVKFDLSSTQAGLKVHSTANSEHIAAAARLYDKGLTTQSDGGYLTDLGRETAEFASSALRILQSKPS